jgi:hypothetical protein
MVRKKCCKSIKILGMAERVNVEKWIYNGEFEKAELILKNK